jgi:hypothetical protein
MKNYRFVLYHLTFWDIIFAASLGLAIEPLFVLSSAAMIIKGFAAHFGRRFSEICVGFFCLKVNPRLLGYYGSFLLRKRPVFTVVCVNLPLSGCHPKSSLLYPFYQ